MAITESGPASPSPFRPSKSVAARRPRLNWRLIIGGTLLLFMGIFVLVLPELPGMTMSQNLGARLRPPSWQVGNYPLGTDQLGRDVLSRVAQAGRYSLLVGLVSVLGSVIMGLPLGVLAGYGGRLVDNVVMRLVDIQLGFPAVLFAIALLALFGPSIQNLILVLSIANWMLYARVVRAEVLALREQDFVLSARALGAHDFAIIGRHLLPNVLPTLTVIMTVQVGEMILLEAGFSFLGLGVQPPNPAWGRMLADSMGYLTRWWLSVIPGAAITLTVLGVNLFGEGLRVSRR